MPFAMHYDMVKIKEIKIPMSYNRMSLLSLNVVTQIDIGQYIIVIIYFCRLPYVYIFKPKM
jgi:hypothetical protein